MSSQPDLPAIPCYNQCTYPKPLLPKPNTERIRYAIYLASTSADLSRIDYAQLVENNSDYTDLTNCYGGAIYVKFGTVQIVDTLISKGQAYDGGALYVYEGIVQLENFEIYENVAANWGGAIYVC